MRLVASNWKHVAPHIKLLLVASIGFALAALCIALTLKVYCK
jgi:hypothetical protein